MAQLVASRLDRRTTHLLERQVPEPERRPSTHSCIEQNRWTRQALRHPAGQLRRPASTTSPSAQDLADKFGIGEHRDFDQLEKFWYDVKQKEKASPRSGSTRNMPKLLVALAPVGWLNPHGWENPARQPRSPSPATRSRSSWPQDGKQHRLGQPDPVLGGAGRAGRAAHGPQVLPGRHHQQGRAQRRLEHASSPSSRPAASPPAGRITDGLTSAVAGPADARPSRRACSRTCVPLERRQGRQAEPDLPGRQLRRR